MQSGPLPQAKHLLQSRTFWLNVLSLFYYVLGQLHVQPAPLDPNTQTVATALLNIVMRMLTSQPVRVR